MQPFENVLLTGASVLAACTCTGRTLGASAIVIAHQNPDESIGRGVSIELCPLETIHRAGGRVAGRPGAGAGVTGGARTMEKLASRVITMGEEGILHLSRLHSPAPLPYNRDIHHNRT